MATTGSGVKPDSVIERIKEAAMRIIADRGMAEMTIRDLARAAGVSEGALYRHYETKEDLVADLYRAQYAQFGRRLREWQVGEVGLAAKLSAIVHRACRLFDEEPVTYRFLLLAQHEVMRRFPVDADSPVAVLHALIAGSHEAHMENDDLAVALFLGLLVQPAASIVNGSLAGPLARYADEIADAVVRVLVEKH